MGNILAQRRFEREAFEQQKQYRVRPSILIDNFLVFL